jgi:hypothetical protein
MDWTTTLGTPVTPLPVDAPKVFDMPSFDHYQDPKKMDVISKIAENAGRDPQLATVAVSILREAGIKPRDYKGQAAAILKWVQTNIYYVNEPDERLQDPLYTLKVRYGDCDDEAILVYALARSIRLPARLVISGVDKRGKKVRYIQGDRHYPSGVNWAHIYLQVGDRPYGQPVWYFAEPTLQVPLGWDVVDNDASMLPELRGAYGDPTQDGSGGGTTVLGMPLPVALFVGALCLVAFGPSLASFVSDDEPSYRRMR